MICSRMVVAMLILSTMAAATGEAADTHALWQARGAGGQACLDIASKAKEANRLIERAGWIVFRPEPADLVWVAIDLEVLADRARIAAAGLAGLDEPAEASDVEQCATNADATAKDAFAASRALSGLSPAD